MRDWLAGWIAAFQDLEIWSTPWSEVSRPAVAGWCDLRKARTWSIVFSSKSFGSLQGKTVDWAFGASAAMSTDVR